MVGSTTTRKGTRRKGVRTNDKKGSGLFSAWKRVLTPFQSVISQSPPQEASLGAAALPAVCELSTSGSVFIRPMASDGFRKCETVAHPCAVVRNARSRGENHGVLSAVSAPSHAA